MLHANITEAKAGYVQTGNNEKTWSQSAVEAPVWGQEIPTGTAAKLLERFREKAKKFRLHFIFASFKQQIVTVTGTENVSLSCVYYKVSISSCKLVYHKESESRWGARLAGQGSQGSEGGAIPGRCEAQ